MYCVIVKKLKFFKEQEGSGSLSIFGIKTPLSKIPLVGPLLFKSVKQVNKNYKMNETVNKFLSAGDNVMPEMHVRYPYSACGPFTKNGERIGKIKETGNSQYVY